MLCGIVMCQVNDRLQYNLEGISKQQALVYLNSIIKGLWEIVDFYSACVKSNGINTRAVRKTLSYTEDIYKNCASCYQAYRSGFGLTNHIKGELIG